MMLSEFLELIYYHFIYSMDSYFISVLLVVIICELFRINKKLDNQKCTKGETHHEENKTG